MGFLDRQLGGVLGESLPPDILSSLSLFPLGVLEPKSQRYSNGVSYTIFVILVPCLQREGLTPCRLQALSGFRVTRPARHFHSSWGGQMSA